MRALIDRRGDGDWRGGLGHDDEPGRRIHEGIDLHDKRSADEKRDNREGREEQQGAEGFHGRGVSTTILAMPGFFF